MIRLQPPRFAGSYEVISSYDDAIDRPELPARDEGESDQDYRARCDKLFAAFRRAISVARETGDWAPVLRPGVEPTRFVLRRIPGRQWLVWDDVAADLTEQRRAALLVRMALVDVRPQLSPTFAATPRVEHLDANGRPTGLGLIGPDSIIDAFFDSLPGGVAVEVIVDLGLTILQHRRISSGN